MDLLPCPTPCAPPRCNDRTRRLVRVKFIALPMESGEGNTEFEPDLRQRERSPAKAGFQFLHRMRTFFTRVIGRLVAARP
jgi:hypothetical protein